MSTHYLAGMVQHGLVSQLRDLSRLGQELVQNPNTTNGDDVASDTYAAMIQGWEESVRRAYPNQQVDSGLRRIASYTDVDADELERHYKMAKHARRVLRSLHGPQADLS